MDEAAYRTLHAYNEIRVKIVISSTTTQLALFANSISHRASLVLKRELSLLDACILAEAIAHKL